MLYAVILAGGRGTRFWPMSRRSRPKQLLRLVSSQSNLLEEAIDRAHSFTSPEQTYLCTNKELLGSLSLPMKGLGEKNIILEPYGRDTAAALALSSLIIEDRDPGAIMVSLNSDHHVKDQIGFSKTIKRAVSVASKGRIVIVGAKPTRPESGYGYIQLGDRIAEGIYAVRRFKEKPTVRTASRYLKSGKYLWNTGIFVWRCDLFLQELSKHMPGLYTQMESIRKSLGTSKEQEAISNAYSHIHPISIDYGLMEKVRVSIAVKAGFDWEDLGSWTSLKAVCKTDSKGNLMVGNSKVIMLDSEGCVVSSDGPLVGALGIRDLIVVATRDAVLVAHKRCGQRVREIVKELERRKLDEYL